MQDYVRAFSTARDAHLLLGPDGTIRAWSAGAAALFGWQAEQAVGLPYGALFPFEGVVEGRPQALLARAAREGHAEESAPRLRKDGSSFWVRSSVVALRDGTGALAGFSASKRDLSEERRAQAALRANEHRFQQIVETTLEGFSVYDGHGRYLYANRRFEEMFGFQPGTLVGTSIFDRVKDRAPVERALERRRAGIPDTSEYEGRRKDGSTFWMASSSSPLLEDGQLVQVVTLTQDITARKRAEAQLRAREAQLREAQAVAQMGSFEVDLLTSQMTRSAELGRIFGLTQTEMESPLLGIADKLHPDDRERLVQQLQEALRGPTRFQSDYRCVRADGVRYLHLRAEVLADAGGKPTRFVGTVQDVTDRRRAEELLQRTGRMARVGGWEMDLATRALVWSPEVYAIREVDPSVTPDVASALAFYPGEAHTTVQAAVDRLLADGTPYDLELPFVTAKGNHLWVRTQGEALLDGGRVTRIFGAFQDITGRKQAELARDEARARLARQERLANIGTLAGGVGHEINNPLTYLLASLQLAADKVGPVTETSPANPSLAQLLAEATDGADRIHRIVRGLRALVLEGSGLQVVHPREALEDAVQVATATLRPVATLVHDLQPVPLVFVDEARLAQALVDLLINAAQSFPPGPAGQHHVRLSTRTGAQGEAILEVSDDGPGMSAETAGRLFEPFFTTKQAGEGTGLGLAIAHRAIASFGGALTCQTAPGAGSTFRITLPPAHRGGPSE
jgi:PAS domain S-box-containing protein